MKIALFTNPYRPDTCRHAAQAAVRLLELGVEEVRCLEGVVGLPQGVWPVAEGDLCDGADAIVVIGGDGTILRAAACAIPMDIPMLCINSGRVGFLTEVELQAMPEALERLVAGEYFIERRMALTGSVRDARGEVLHQESALNEIYVRACADAAMVNLSAAIGENTVGRYDADGLIIASPTGSTGYSLSAGGPIVTPEIPCMVMTPICAHNLQAKPVVLSPGEVVRVSMREPTRRMLFFCDGRKACEVEEGQHIVVERNMTDASFVRFSRGDFFQRLKQKLSEW